MPGELPADVTADKGPSEDLRLRRDSLLNMTAGHNKDKLNPFLCAAERSECAVGMLNSPAISQICLGPSRSGCEARLSCQVQLSVPCFAQEEGFCEGFCTMPIVNGPLRRDSLLMQGRLLLYRVKPRKYAVVACALSAEDLYLLLRRWLPWKIMSMHVKRSCTSDAG